MKRDKHRSRSHSPVSKERKRRGRHDSPSEQSSQHRRHGDSRSDHSPRARDGGGSASPESHRDRRRRKEASRRDHREDRFPIKQEPGLEPPRRVKREPHDDHDLHHHRRHNDDRRREAHRRRQQEGEGNFAAPSADEAAVPEKEKPNFELSGKLTEDTNTFRGVVVKYNEPAEARKPKRRWRLYGFKGDESLPMLPIHRQSAYLLGRDRRVADIPVDHPSCSKQHAVLQYRLTDYIRPDGSQGRKVRPYIIDLGSANGTFVNNQRVDSERYVELFERDLIKFGFSSREYVLLHENVDTTEVAQNSDDD